MKKSILLWFPACLAMMLASCVSSENKTSSELSDSSSKDTSTTDISTSGSDVPVDGNLVLNVKIPAPLNDGEHITIGSTLNDWTPSNLDYAAKKIDDLNYQLVLKVDNSSDVQVEYKWTKQLPSFSASDQWKGVEKDENGAEMANRVITIPANSDKVVEVFDTVAQFANPDAPVEHTVVGNLDIIEGMKMPQFADNRTRTIRVWTPEGYNPNDKETKYPVIYMQDAQNVFDDATSFAGEWMVDETITQFIKDGVFDGAIVVGIDNSSYRMKEYTPNWGDTANAEGELYGRFLVETLKPYIDANYNVLTDKDNTMIAGSSMGGLISFSIGLSYPEVFGMVAGFSSSFQINSKENRQLFINSLDFSKPMPRLYLDAGKLETLYTYIDPVSNELVNAGYPENLIYTLIDEKGQHSETSWRERFPNALKWLISDEDGNYVAPTCKANFTIKLSSAAAAYIDSLGVDGTLYLYTGQLSSSIVLQKQEDGTYFASVDVKINDKINFYVLYYLKGKLETFALNEDGTEFMQTVTIKEETSNFTYEIAKFENVVKTNITLKVPSNTQSLFDEVNQGDAKLYLYTSSLANSYIAEKVDDTTYAVETFEKPGTVIKFNVLYYGTGVEMFATTAEGKVIEEKISFTVGETSPSNFTYEVLGWQLPVVVTINITLPAIEIPEGNKLEVGLYGGPFGGSWRNCQVVELQEDGTYSCQVKLYSGNTIQFTVGYVLYKKDASTPYDQKFESNGSAAFDIVIPYENYVPGNPTSHTISYAVSGF